ncbi:MAG: hypothetical protein HYW78_00835 [Parcubacteria group bacterium]|nr:hypothetical protein [Parcubacteria group bacterium]
MGTWQQFIDSLKGGAGTLIRGELEQLVGFARNDADDFIRSQGNYLEYLLQLLAAGYITKEQFAGYVEDMRALVEMEKLKLAVAAQASAQRIINGLVDLVIGRLLSLL